MAGGVSLFFALSFDASWHCTETLTLVVSGNHRKQIQLFVIPFVVRAEYSRFSLACMSQPPDWLVHRDVEWVERMSHSDISTVPEVYQEFWKLFYKQSALSLPPSPSFTAITSTQSGTMIWGTASCWPWYWH